MHQPLSKSDFIARLDRAHRVALEIVTAGSIVWLVGLGILFAIPFVFGFENPWRLIEHYPSFPVMLFILMVGWSLGIFLVVGVCLNYVPKRKGVSCPHCEHLVSLFEDKQVRHLGTCPGCRMPIYSLSHEEPVPPPAAPVETAPLVAAGDHVPAADAVVDTPAKTA